ncbi:hypothetical protein K1719_047557 [Acacia pycnantha]|nr:hypothetical protein K1719_047557 [Acacia pycnantha]
MDALWVRFLKERSICAGNDIIPRVENRRVESETWKGIICAWKDTLKGLRRRMGDGHRVRFWEDCWLPCHGKLRTYSSSEINDVLKEATVADY